MLCVRVWHPQDQVRFVLSMCSASLCTSDGGGTVGNKEGMAKGWSSQRFPHIAGAWLFRMALLRGWWDEGTYWLIHSGSGM